jgi:hypothetical protein
MRKKTKPSVELVLTLAGGEQLLPEISPLLEGTLRAVVKSATRVNPESYPLSLGMGELKFDSVNGSAQMSVVSEEQLDFLLKLVPCLSVDLENGPVFFEASIRRPIVREPVTIIVSTILAETNGGPIAFLRTEMGDNPFLSPADYRFGGHSKEGHTGRTRCTIFASKTLADLIRGNGNRLPVPGGDLPAVFPEEVKRVIAFKKAAKLAKLEKENGALPRANSPPSTSSGRSTSAAARLGALFVASGVGRGQPRAPVGAPYPEGSPLWVQQKKKLDSRSRAKDAKIRASSAKKAIAEVMVAAREAAAASRYANSYAAHRAATADQAAFGATPKFPSIPPAQPMAASQAADAITPRDALQAALEVNGITSDSIEMESSD